MSIKRSILILFLFFTVFAFPKPVAAESVCVCDIKDLGGGGIQQKQIASVNKNCENKKIGDLSYFNCKIVDSTSSAAANVSYEASTIDPRCWKKEECMKARADIKMDANDAAFYQGTDALEACKDPSMGFCSPIGQVETKITFGTVNTFQHVGDFLQFIFKYGVSIAGVLAVVMIIVAGFQWTTSGGNSEAISSARKRIGNAMMGLFIAVLSFLILNIINPYLVNLRLPQTWMIRGNTETQLAGSYCDYTESSETRVACEKSGMACMLVSHGTGPCQGMAKVIAIVSAMSAGAAANVGGTAGSRIVVSEEAAAGGYWEGMVGFGQAAGNSARLIIPAKELGMQAGKIALNAVRTGGKWVLAHPGKTAKYAVGFGALGSGIYVEEKVVGIGGKVMDFVYDATGLSALVKLLKELFIGDRIGICTPVVKDLQKGDICDPDQKPSSCVSGKCIASSHDVLAKCWSGQRTGFCSDGLKNAYCNADDECASNKCRVYLSEMGMGDIKACSDGTQASACENDLDCDSTLIPKITTLPQNDHLVCYNNRCTWSSLAGGEKFAKCQNDTNCGTRLFCWNIDEFCTQPAQVTSLKPMGVCADKVDPDSSGIKEALKQDGGVLLSPLCKAKLQVFGEEGKGVDYNLCKDNSDCNQDLGYACVGFDMVDGKCVAGLIEISKKDDVYGVCSKSNTAQQIKEAHDALKAAGRLISGC